MNFFHLHCQVISRSDGRSAIAAAAYRSATLLFDERLQKSFDFTKKQTVQNCGVFIPVAETKMKKPSVPELWNLAEQSEKRSNSCVAREFEVALPKALPEEEKKAIALEFMQWVVERYQVAGQLDIHGLETQNPHFHALFTTRIYSDEKLGAKTRILDDHKTGSQEIIRIRQKLCELINAKLLEHGLAPISHLSYADQGVIKQPTKHLGVNATALERKGISTERGNYNRNIRKLNQMIGKGVDSTSIIDLQNQIENYENNNLTQKELDNGVFNRKSDSRSIRGISETEHSQDRVFEPTTQSSTIGSTTIREIQAGTGFGTQKSGTNTERITKKDERSPLIYGAERASTCVYPKSCHSDIGKNGGDDHLSRGDFERRSGTSRGSTDFDSSEHQQIAGEYFEPRTTLEQTSQATSEINQLINKSLDNYKKSAVRLGYLMASKRQTAKVYLNIQEQRENKKIFQRLDKAIASYQQTAPNAAGACTVNKFLKNLENIRLVQKRFNNTGKYMQTYKRIAPSLALAKSLKTVPLINNLKIIFEELNETMSSIEEKFSLFLPPPQEQNYEQNQEQSTTNREINTPDIINKESKTIFKMN